MFVSNGEPEAAGSYVSAGPDGDQRVRPMGIKEEIMAHRMIGTGKGRNSGHEKKTAEQQSEQPRTERKK